MSVLHIEIHSFSYKKGGIPKDSTGNGGGYAFDCRGILNPGRIDQYKPMTGAEKPVQEFLETKTKMPEFLKAAHEILSLTLDNYVERGFEHLQINFGCTGGQHRSVYAAIQTAKYIQKNYPMTKVTIQHDEQPHLGS